MFPGPAENLALWTGRRDKTGVARVTGRLAQLVERLLYTQNVGGSIPSPPTTLAGRPFLPVKPHCHSACALGLLSSMFRVR